MAFFLLIREFVCKLYANFKICIQMEDVTTGIILDTRRARKDGKYPVKLRVTYLRKQKYYPTKYFFSTEEFNAIMKRNPRKKDYKETQKLIEAIETRAIKIIEDLPNFTFNLFQRQFTDGKIKTKTNIDYQDVYASFKRYIDDLTEEGNIGTAKLYEWGMKSLQDFEKELYFADVTPDFLKKYEKWMLNHGKSYSTIGIYTRQLRTIFNKAIDEGHVNRSLYPFGRRKYETPTGKNVKKALMLDDIEKIFNYIPETKSEEMYRDFWAFSYLANGVNVKDMIKLKYKDIQDGKIIFLREKTKRSNRVKPRPIVVPFTDELKEIIDKWGNKDQSPNNYIFNYLTDDTTPERELKIKKQLVKQMNKYTRRIAKKLGIEKDVTTYVARHSFVTVMKLAGASLEFISESVGHASLKSTDNYADSFNDEIKQKFAKALTNFGKQKEG